MSEWRQKGFVQDSDEEEEESHIECRNVKQDTRPTGRVERVERVLETAKQQEGQIMLEDTVGQDQNGARSGPGAWDKPSEAHEGKFISHTPRRHTSPRRPTPSPFTPTPKISSQRWGSESPDPLQSSLHQKQRLRLSAPLQSQLPPISKPKFPDQIRLRSNAVISSQNLSDAMRTTGRSSISGQGWNVKASAILGEFGVAALSDDEPNQSQHSDAESNLSDFPSDLSEKEPLPNPSYATPHRHTAVQVVIPSSTGLQHQLAEEDERRHHFRQRKPIQLHPYVLEGERYRREVQSRGLKPVPREISPQRKQGNNPTVTQEEEFTPFRSLSSSPPDTEIFVSTPIPRKTRTHIRPHSSTQKSNSNPPRRRLPATQLRLPKAPKRRRLNGSPAQALTTPARISESRSVPDNIWSVPPRSPPYSSSPPLNGQLGKVRPMSRVVNLPTPSSSVIFQDEPQLPPNSDSDPVPGSIQRTTRKLRRPLKIGSSDGSSSDSETDNGETRQVDGELQEVSKKIRGVLPASWLRIDRQAQERRQALASRRARLNVTSPELSEPQRGVAQRITRPVDRTTGLGGPTVPPQGVVVISDDSDNDSDPSNYQQPNSVRASAQDASALAAMFDDRYADSDDDLASMEHDQLQLPRLGGSGTKRKRQPNVTQTRGHKRTDTLTDNLKSNRSAKPTSGLSGRKKHARSKGPHKAPPPALSVMDVELPKRVPQFLKLARRVAHRDIDQARQSPCHKQIRLHTVQDTEDANNVLRQWQQGLLKPKVKPSIGQQPRSRPPLLHTTDNRQHVPRSSSIGNNTSKGDGSDPLLITLNTKPRKRNNVNPALQMLQRTSTIVRKSTRRKAVTRASKGLQKGIQCGPTLIRSAQLEEDERNFSRSHRRIAFQNGLQHVDQRCGYHHHLKQPLLNLQLERFLADDDAVLPPLPTTKDTGEAREEASKESNITSSTLIPRKRLIRKAHAQRLDVDSREYRQPSEPVFEPFAAVPVMVSSENAPTEEHENILQGLGLFGTRYPIAFDITPLKSDTYFHSDTFVGSEDLRRALSISKHDARSLDEYAGYCTILHGTTAIKCGPWSDGTYSQLSEITTLILSSLTDGRDPEKSETPLADVLKSLSTVLRELSSYFASHLSFSDPVDRKGFAAKMQHFLRSLFDQVSVVPLVTRSFPDQVRNYNRVLSHLLVVCTQVQQIAQHSMVASLDRTKLIDIIRDISRLIVKDITMNIQELYGFHEKNKLHKERENGIQDSDILIESVVICMHALELLNTPSLGFWDFVSQELSTVSSTNQVQTFENIWATIFSLLPFTEFDLSGIPNRGRILSFKKDNWGCIRDILTRIFALYSNTFKQHGSSVNDYIRVNLTRCYVLINGWYWKRPEQILNVIFDFFSKHGLKPLRRETATGSASFLQDFATANSLTLAPNESSFHVALKCLVTGLQGMRDTYPEKKIRSFVFRLIPNHGRMYPKDQPLEEESLAALRNHHDLLSTLYCAAPPSCRPKLDLFRDLVSHKTSHREACRVNVRAWANLSAFQLSTGEPYQTTRPFAIWYREIMHQTLKQYRLARTEAEEYLKSGVFDGAMDVSAVMVRQTMERNQEQVIATLRDSITGMKKAIEYSKEQIGLATFLTDSDIVHLLELPHLEDHRLLSVIRDTLAVFRQYASLQRTKVKQQVSQTGSDESQDYGDFPDLDDLDDSVVLQSVQTDTVSLHSRLGFIEAPLWHLMSNAFGAERPPDDNLLMDCIDTWVLIAGEQVTAGGKQWSHYMDSFSQVSWQQLRHTEQTRKFGPYFMSAVIAYDPAAYDEHRHEFLTSLLLCLADRESMLRFQHRLLDAIVRTDPDNPLFRNLPFLQIGQSGGLDITVDSLKSRRLTLISSLLFNMREDVYTTSVEEPIHTTEVKRTYAAMLKDFMARLKSNYQQLQQGDTVTGAYVEFVQKLVQFLKQYTSDICPVLPFFTDSVAFPLPSTDPTYVIGRLRGYAPKAKDPGAAKQLCVFVETVAQQAAADNQQVYLVDQLTKALCIDEAPVPDRVALQKMLFQGIFPAYIEEAFSSRTNHLIARPILQCLPAVLDDMFFDLRVSQSSSISTTIQNIVSIAHAFIRGTEQLKGDILLFQQPTTMRGLTYMFEVAISVSRLVDYIMSRTVKITVPGKLSLITYLEEFSGYVVRVFKRSTEDNFPSYQGDAHSGTTNPELADILAFCRRGLKSSLETNWTDDEGSLWFGQGRAKKQVVFDTRSNEDETIGLLDILRRFQDTVHELSDDEMQGVRVTENDTVV